jgi:hypothetical protein
MSILPESLICFNIDKLIFRIADLDENYKQKFMELYDNDGLKSMFGSIVMTSIIKIMNMFDSDFLWNEYKNHYKNKHLVVENLIELHWLIYQGDELMGILSISNYTQYSYEKPLLEISLMLHNKYRNKSFLKKYCMAVYQYFRNIDMFNGYIFCFDCLEDNIAINKISKNFNTISVKHKNIYKIGPFSIDADWVLHVIHEK